MLLEPLPVGLSKVELPDPVVPEGGLVAEPLSPEPIVPEPEPSIVLDPEPIVLEPVPLPVEGDTAVEPARLLWLSVELVLPPA
jgi:hypothetical protein